MPSKSSSRSLRFKVYHGEEGEVLDNDDTWLELVGYRVTEFVLLEPQKMDLVTAKSWFTRYLPRQPPVVDPLASRPPSSCTISAVVSLSCTDIKWQLWPIRTTADWRNWIRGCVDRKMPPVAVVDAIAAAAKAPASNTRPSPEAQPTVTAPLEIASYTQAEQHAREIIARVDAQMNLLTVGASMSTDEHYAAWKRVGAAATKILACLRPDSSSPDVQPQANYPSSLPGYQPVRLPPPLANVWRGQPQPQANTYKGLGVPPGFNPRQTNQPAPAAPPPAPANQAAGGGCGQPAVGQQGAVNITALDSASSTSATSPVQRGTPPELTTPQNHKAAASSVPKRPGRPPGTGAKAKAATPAPGPLQWSAPMKAKAAPGQWRQSLMVAPPQGTTIPCWVPPAAPPASKRAKPNPTTTATRPTAVGTAAAADAAEVASPAPPATGAAAADADAAEVASPAPPATGA